MTSAPDAPAAAAYQFAEYAIGSIDHRGTFTTAAAFAPPANSVDVYLSAYRFAADYERYAKEHPNENGNPSVARFPGSCLPISLHYDLDSETVNESLRDAQRLVRYLVDECGIDGRAIRIAYSGSKGFHVEIPAACFDGFTASAEAPEQIKRLASRLIDALKLPTFDTTVYDKPRLWRVLNTINSKTGRYKIPLTAEELFTLTLSEIEALAGAAREVERLPDDEWRPIPELVTLKNECAEAITKGAYEKAAPLPGKIPQTKRHPALKTEAARLRNLNLNADEIDGALQAINKTRCDPPLPVAEVRALADWAATLTANEATYVILEEIDRRKTTEEAAEPEQSGVPVVRRRLTDTGNAERLVAYHGADLHYSYQWDKWVVWDKRRWQIDATGAIDQRAKRTARRIYREAEVADDKTESALIANWARKSEERGRLASMIALARSEPGIPITPAELDADPWAFNCLNGTVDLRTSSLRPHNRADLCTKLAPVTYDPAATCPLWLAFLETIMRGDTELIAFLQRAFGYALTGLTTEQVIFILFGTGANGKTTLIETLRAMLGDYGQQADFTTFLARDRDSVRNDLARLVGARFVAAVEADAGGRLSEVVVKSISGGDTITTRFLFKEFFEFVPQFKLFLATNHKPEVRGTDEAIWRRLRLVPFEFTIPEKERDRSLPAKLHAELPGILAWAVRGCLEWQRIGLGVPAAVLDATAEYRAEQDILDGFLTERCIIAPSATISASALYAGYRDFAKAGGEEELTQTKFGRLLKADPQGRFKNDRTMTGRYWHGIALKPDETRRPYPDS